MVKNSTEAEIKSILAKINKEIGGGGGKLASEYSGEAGAGIYKYSTGILSLDRYLGVEGILGGRIINLWGWEQTGKTLTALTIGASFQRQGKKVAFLDAENTYSDSLARAVGINPDELMIYKSSPERIYTGEDYFTVASLLIQQGVELIIVDSAPALMPSTRLNATIGQGQKATHAQMMSEGLAQLTTYLNATQKSVVIFINQIRQKPMVKFGRTDGPTGGEALKFFASYSLEVKSKSGGDIIKEVPSNTGGFEKRKIGATVFGSLHKNKTAPIPVNDIEWDVYFENVVDKDGMSYSQGVDIFKDTFKVAVEAGVIETKSSWFSWGDLKGNGEDNFILAMRGAGHAVLDKLREEVFQKKAMNNENT